MESISEIQSDSAAETVDAFTPTTDEAADTVTNLSLIHI